MATTSLDAFKVKDTRFVVVWLKSKGLHKLCSIFEGIQEPFVLSLTCKSLLNHVYIHSFWSIIEATGKFPRSGGIWSPGMDLDNGAFEQLFGLGRGEFEQKFSKNSNARGWPGGGGMLKLRFDWYITNLHLGGRLRKLWRAFTKWSPFKKSLSKFSQMVSEKEWS